MLWFVRFSIDVSFQSTGTENWLVLERRRKTVPRSKHKTQLFLFAGIDTEKLIKLKGNCNKFACLASCYSFKIFNSDEIFIVSMLDVFSVKRENIKCSMQ